jgi:short-subunit dehydrogenase
MTVNYTGMVNVSQTVLPYMINRNAGDFIVYGSVAGIVVTNRFGAYGATKAATNFFMKVLMNENRNTNIRFQLVFPPAVDTPLINQAKERGPYFLKDIQITRKNLVSPELVVKTVEKCLEKGVKINYPGPAKLIRILHPIFPNMITRIVNNKNRI